MPPITLGRSILTVISLCTSIAPYLADWNETHIHNPNWPPHARYHNGQTMTTGLLLGLCSLYYLHFTPSPTPFPPSSIPGKTLPKETQAQLLTTKKTHLQLHNLNLALLFIHLYYVPSLSGIWYPGAGWTDPEFAKLPGGEVRKQLWVFSGFLGVSWLGWWVERGRVLGAFGLEKGKVGGKGKGE